MSHSTWLAHGATGATMRRSRWAHQRFRLLLGGAAVTVLGLGGCAPGDRRSADDIGPDKDLAAACDAALGIVRPSEIRSHPWPFDAGRLVGAGGPGTLGAVAGATWIQSSGELYVLDGAHRAVLVFDRDGRFSRSFGRPGQGPGEFEEVGRTFSGRSLASDGQRWLAVAGVHHIHLFTLEGAFIERFRPTEPPAWLRHLATASNSSFVLALDGSFRVNERAWGVRTSTELLEIPVRSVATSRTIGRIGNRLSLAPPPAEGEVFRRAFPYTERRIFDAIAGVLAVPSRAFYGVCFFDLAGRLGRAHRVDAQVIPVDASERSRVIEARHGSSRPPPFLPWPSWEAFYEGRWPQTVPRFRDIALAPDSVAWVIRPDRSGRQLIDLFHPERGYLYSLVPPTVDWLPAAFAEKCVFVVEEGERHYGLRRWCLSPRRPSAPGP